MKCNYQILSKITVSANLLVLGFKFLFSFQSTEENVNMQSVVWQREGNRLVKYDNDIVLDDNVVWTDSLNLLMIVGKLTGKGTYQDRKAADKFIKNGLQYSKQDPESPFEFEKYNLIATVEVEKILNDIKTDDHKNTWGIPSETYRKSCGCAYGLISYHVKLILKTLCDKQDCVDFYFVKSNVVAMVLKQGTIVYICSVGTDYCTTSPT